MIAARALETDEAALKAGAVTAADAAAAAGHLANLTGQAVAMANSGNNGSSGGKPPCPNQPAAEAPSSRILGQNMEDTGIIRPPDSAAHHIVAGTDARAAEARSVLKQEGIGINKAGNGVFLPKNSTVANPSGMQVHSTVHTDVYYDAVNSALRNSQPGTVGDALQDIGNQLQNGTFPH